MTKKTLLIALLVLAVPAVLLAIPVGELEGTPNIQEGQVAGAYVWHDGNGFHVRFTTKANERFFHGKVCADKITSLDGYHVDEDARNKVFLSEDKKCINVEVYNKVKLNGFNFQADGNIEFRLKVDSGDLKPANIWIGKATKNPPSSPLVINQ